MTAFGQINHENCLDNAVTKSFFQLHKRECMRRKTYLTREDARQDYLVTSRCFTTLGADMATLIGFLQLNLNGNTSAGKKVSSEERAIQFDLKQTTRILTVC